MADMDAYQRSAAIRRLIAQDTPAMGPRAATELTAQQRVEDFFGPIPKDPNIPGSFVDTLDLSGAGAPPPARSWGQRNIGDPLRRALQPVGDAAREIGQPIGAAAREIGQPIGAAAREMFRGEPSPQQGLTASIRPANPQAIGAAPVGAATWEAMRPPRADTPGAFPPAQPDPQAIGAAPVGAETWEAMRPPRADTPGAFPSAQPEPQAGLTAPRPRPASLDLPAPDAVSVSNPDAYNANTNTRPPEAQALSVWDRVFGERGSDRRAASSRALMAMGAAMMTSNGDLGQALGEGIQAGLLQYDQTIDALRSEEREARRMGLEDEAKELNLALTKLKLARAQQEEDVNPMRAAGETVNAWKAYLSQDPAFAWMDDDQRNRLAVAQAGLIPDTQVLGKDDAFSTFLE